MAGRHGHLLRFTAIVFVRGGQGADPKKGIRGAAGFRHADGGQTLLGGADSVRGGGHALEGRGGAGGEGGVGELRRVERVGEQEPVSHEAFLPICLVSHLLLISTQQQLMQGSEEAQKVMAACLRFLPRMTL